MDYSFYVIYPALLNETHSQKRDFNAFKWITNCGIPAFLKLNKITFEIISKLPLKGLVYLQKTFCHNLFTLKNLFDLLS